VLELICAPGVNVGVTHGTNSGGRKENPRHLQHSSRATHERKLLRFVFVPHEEKTFKGLSMKALNEHERPNRDLYTCRGDSVCQAGQKAKQKQAKNKKNAFAFQQQMS
jgi:hypothetical protein